MFARLKTSGDYQYVQVVHNERIDGRVRQRVIATLGRLDVLQQSGQLEGLLESLARFSEHVAVLNALSAHQITPTRTIHLGPPLVFQRLWEELGLPGIFERLLTGRKFEFSLERVVFLTVLHPCSHPAATAPPSIGVASTRWGRSTASNSSTSIVRWAGWANRCRQTNPRRPRL
jgi:hypothetical protein